MKEYTLNTVSRFIDPQFINKIKGNNQGRTAVQEDCSISIYNTKLLFADSSNTLEPGTLVEVFLGRSGFSCVSIAEFEQFKAEREAALHIEREEAKAKRNAHREESEIFNASLPIPVKWTPGIKDVLSGLSATSNGTGRNKATVEHVFILEDMQVGKLKRSAHDFLCGNSMAKFGGRYVDPISDSWTDGDGKLYAPKITCKACLAIANRLEKVAKK